MKADLITQIILVLVPMILSLAVHEWAHAWTAFQLGDDTAARQGRLTLNPLSHIDPVGTLLLPIILVASGAGLFFGWARPVPVDPSRFRPGISMKKGMLWTAAAGPVSNLLIAVLMGVAMTVMRAVEFTDLAVWALVRTMFLLNVVLAVFNLIPVPPLDGNRVMVGLLPDRAETAYYRFMEKNPLVVPMAFMLLIFGGGRFIAWPIEVVSRLLLTITGNA
jgi:Zn-dependent protease